MSVHITLIDDKDDGFTTEFTVTTRYKRTFEPRPAGMDQGLYARQSVELLIEEPVEITAGVTIKSQPAVIITAEEIIDLNGVPL